MDSSAPLIRRTTSVPRPGGRYYDPSQPSLLLMQAVLEDAIRTFLHAAPTATTRARRLWREELEWFTAHDRSHPFTFERICEAIGVDPDGLRTRVLDAGTRHDWPPLLPPLQSRTTPRGTMPYRCSMR
jgi:hypothetical protein